MRVLGVALLVALTSVSIAARGDLTLVTGGLTSSIGNRNAVNHIFVDGADNPFTAETRFSVSGQDAFIVRRMNAAGAAAVWTYSFSNVGTTLATGVQVWADATRVVAIGNDQVSGGSKRGLAVVLNPATGAEIFRRTLTDATYHSAAVVAGDVFVSGVAKISGINKVIVNRINLASGVSTVFADPIADGAPIGFIDSATGLRLAAVRKTGATARVQVVDFLGGFAVVFSSSEEMSTSITNRFVGGNLEDGGFSANDVNLAIFEGFRGQESVVSTSATALAGPVVIGTRMSLANGTIAEPQLRYYFYNPIEQRLLAVRATPFTVNGATVDTRVEFPSFISFPELLLTGAAKRGRSGELLVGQGRGTNGSTGKDGILFSPFTNRFFAFDGGSGREDAFLTVAVNSKDEVFVGGFATNAAFQRASFFGRFTQVPLANGDVFTGFKNRVFEGDVTSNDTAVNAGSYSIATNPTHGTVSISPQGDFTYGPNLNFVGRDSFQYTLTTPLGSDTVTVSLVIQPTIVNLSVPAQVDSGASFTAGLVLSNPVPAAISGRISTLDIQPGFKRIFFSQNDSARSTTLTAPAVVVDTPVRIQASFDEFGPFKANRTVLVKAVALDLTVNEANPIGGDVIVATLRSSAEIPQNTVFSVAYDAQLSGPSTITLPEFELATSFQVNSALVFSAANRTIRLTSGARTVAVTVTLQAGGLRFFTTRSPGVVGGQSSVATIELTGPAPRNLVFQVTYGPKVSGPATVTIPTGATKFDFAFNSQAVTVPASETISVKRGRVTINRTLSILPFIEQSAILVNPTTVRGGARSTATVVLTAEAFGVGQAVTLASSNNAIATFGRSSITVPATKFRTDLLVLTFAVAASSPVTLSATCGGVTKTTVLTVTP
jgi:hypothetical protein